jgi:hypothetical protein
VESSPELQERTQGGAFGDDFRGYAVFELRTKDLMYLAEFDDGVQAKRIRASVGPSERIPQKFPQD